MVEIGKKYNKLTVLALDHTDKYYHKFFKCRCDCGNEVVLRSDKIDSGKTKSCGCLNTIGRINDISGQRFGKITVLRPTERRSSTSVVWECRCDCGNLVYSTGTNLRAGRTKSCGKCNKSTDITGMRSGKLVALEPTEKKKNGSIVWKCKCDCGNFHEVAATNIMRKTILSCGCTISRGEDRIAEILTQNNINFKKQYTFDDLKDKQKLQFDFGIFTKDNQLYCLIEYQGNQHYIEPTGNSTWTSPQIHDQMKKEYCEKHNILLIEIPYTDFEKVDFEYLKERNCIPNVQSKTN